MPENGKSKRHRSPEHPMFGLEEAIRQARALYEAEHFNYTNVTTALAHWGYTASSGTGLRIVAALRHFGLIEEEGTGDARKVKLSESGRVLALKSRGDPEWDAAVRAAAITPGIYAKLWSEWGGNGRLPSDKNLAYELETKWGFNPNSIDSFISDFKGSLEFANLLENGNLSSMPDDSPDEAEEVEDPGRPVAKAPMDQKTEGQETAPSVRVEDYTIPLRGAGTAVLSIPVPLSRGNYEKLKGWLEWAEDSLTAEEPDADDGGA